MHWEHWKNLGISKDLKNDVILLCNQHWFQDLTSNLAVALNVICADCTPVLRVVSSVDQC